MYCVGAKCTVLSVRTFIFVLCIPVFFSASCLVPILISVFSLCPISVSLSVVLFFLSLFFSIHFPFCSFSLFFSLFHLTSFLIPPLSSGIHFLHLSLFSLSFSSKYSFLHLPSYILTSCLHLTLPSILPFFIIQYLLFISSSVLLPSPQPSLSHSFSSSVQN